MITTQLGSSESSGHISRLVLLSRVHRAHFEFSSIQGAQGPFSMLVFQVRVLKGILNYGVKGVYFVVSFVIRKMKVYFLV